MLGKAYCEVTSGFMGGGGGKGLGFNSLKFSVCVCDSSQNLQIAFCVSTENNPV